jgi:DNA-binding protein Fis
MIPKIPSQNLSEHLIQTLDDYFTTLEEQDACNLHAMVVQQIEKPLIEYVLAKAEGNQTKTANMLGINRNTLRKKIIQYDIIIDQP